MGSAKKGRAVLGAGGTAVFLRYCRIARICLRGFSWLDHRAGGEVGKAPSRFAAVGCRRCAARGIGGCLDDGCWQRPRQAVGGVKLGRWAEGAALPEFDRLDKQRCSGVRTLEAEGMRRGNQEGRLGPWMGRWLRQINGRGTTARPG